MKKIVKPSMLIVIGLLVAITGFRSNEVAPTARVGYMSINDIVLQIPEYSTGRGALDTMIYEFNVVLQTKLTEFQQKQQAFVQDSATINEVVKDDKIKELQNLSQSIQAFKQVSEEEVRKQDSVLVQPVFTDLQKAIDQVAEEHGFTLVVNTDVRATNGPGMVLYADDSNDISEQVLEVYRTMK